MRAIWRLSAWNHNTNKVVIGSKLPNRIGTFTWRCEILFVQKGDLEPTADTISAGMWAGTACKHGGFRLLFV